MRIPRHWATASGRAESPRGRAAALTCFGWSNTSLADAQSRAADSLARMIARVRAGEPFPARYAYASRPLREEIVQTVSDGPSGPNALVTRNAYGALILNTAGVMFVDVDQPASRWRDMLRGFARWRRRVDIEPPIPERLTSFLATHPQWRVRVYRTRSGWRYLVVHDVFDPRAARTRTVLEELGCDPRYVQLTRVQECFRARLTPKPWRCGIALPPGRHPREDPEVQGRFARWQVDYHAACEPFATCQFIAELGEGSAAAEAARVIQLHDGETRAGSDLPLA
jgi:hypothetical protein